MSDNSEASLRRGRHVCGGDDVKRSVSGRHGRTTLTGL